MTNEEKYTTTDERVTAFRKFCRSQKRCDKCSASLVQSKRKNEFGFDGCALAWLALEYKDEEKPMPCPCCGAPVMVRERPWPWTPEQQHIKCYKVVCERCGLQTGEEATPGDAVALWNRRMK